MCVVKKKAVFCYYCITNYKKTKRDNFPAFIINSHLNWKKAMERFTIVNSAIVMENIICIVCQWKRRIEIVLNM